MVHSAPLNHWRPVVQVVAGRHDVMISRMIIGGHLELGRGEANSEPIILLTTATNHPTIFFCQIYKREKQHKTINLIRQKNYSE